MGEFSDPELARLAFALEARQLSDWARGAAFPPPDEEPGIRSHHAHVLYLMSLSLLRSAVVADRTEGVSWSTIGSKLDGTSRQAAHERWKNAVSAFGRDLAVRTPHGGIRLTHGGQNLDDPAQAFSELERWYVEADSFRSFTGKPATLGDARASIADPN